MRISRKWVHGLRKKSVLIRSIRSIRVPSYVKGQKEIPTSNQWSWYSNPI